jgi:uncharacterized DUF497 family protein
VGRIERLRWRDRVEHIAKHEVMPAEVEEVVLDDREALLEKAGPAKKDPSQTVYVLLGRTQAGRYLMVLLIDEGRGVGFPITARDMNQAERRRYSR